MEELSSLYSLWIQRKPRFDTRYEDFLRTYCDYGKATNNYSESKAKIFGPAYEFYIVAFFIGLYADRRKPLPSDPDQKKDFGHQIMFWGNFESRNLRTAYPQIRDYIFMALIDKTDIDYIKLDKGDIEATSVVSSLVNTMEEYANYGFDFLTSKLDEDADWLSSNDSLLQVFLDFVEEGEKSKIAGYDDKPESLD